MKFLNLRKIKIKELAGFIIEYLKKHGVKAILVGGSCVSIYTKNKYQSYDLDLVTYSELDELETILGKIGFRRTGRLFEHSDCPYILDFVAPPVSIGGENPITVYNTIESKRGSIILLTPTDCVKDRLAAYLYWNDPQSLEQAILVARDNRINWNDIRNWLREEGFSDKYQIIKARLMKK